MRHSPVIVSERLWRRQFEATPDIVGRTLILDGHGGDDRRRRPTTFRRLRARRIVRCLGTAADLLASPQDRNATRRPERDGDGDLRAPRDGEFDGEGSRRIRGHFQPPGLGVSPHEQNTGGGADRPTPPSPPAACSHVKAPICWRCLSVVTGLTVLIVGANVANLLLACGGGSSTRARSASVAWRLSRAHRPHAGCRKRPGLRSRLGDCVRRIDCDCQIARARVIPPDPSGTTINADFTLRLQFGWWRMQWRWRRSVRWLSRLAPWAISERGASRCCRG